MPEIIKINDYMSPCIDAYTRLTEAMLRNRLESEKGIFIAESPKVISLALKCGITPVSMLTSENHIHGSAKEVIENCGDIPIYTADGEILEKITGFKLTRGVLCAMKRPVQKSPEEICKNASRIAVMENIADSTNIGAIFRSAAALDVDAVLCTPSCCDPLCRRAVRVSMGTVFQIPWTYIDDWESSGISKLKSMGFTTVSMALTDDSVSLDDKALKNKDKLAIILGTEGDGLLESTVAKSDITVRIPMSHGVDSLNVAAASAVAFWELRKR